MALTRKKLEGSFKTIKLELSYTYEGKRRRNLQRALETKEKEVTITCEPTLTVGDSSTFNCGDKGDEPIIVDIEDDQISGVPENIKLPENPTPDFTNETNLEKFNDLPSVNIKNITSNNCSSSGKYIITGEILNGQLENADNLTIPFATPDSSGLCSMEVKSKNVEIICENTEEFTAPDVITIGTQTIYNKYNNETLFKISEDFSVSGFTCTISDNSLKTPFPTNYTITPSSSDSSRARTRFSKKSSGLSGGAIAGIVIACVVAVAAVAAVSFICKKGSISKSHEVVNSVDNTSSINRFNVENKNYV